MHTGFTRYCVFVSSEDTGVILIKILQMTLQMFLFNTLQSQIFMSLPVTSVFHCFCSLFNALK